MKIEVFESDSARDAGLWYWRLRAANNRIIADGAESYTRKRDAVRAAEKMSAMLLMPTPVVVKS